MAKQTLPNLKLGGSRGKVVGFLLLAVVLWFVVTSPLESAHFVNHVVHSVKTFFGSF
jgi:hypothetical protein